MTAAVLWDTRSPQGLCIEMEATRYMRAVGPAAWSVYTFLIQCAALAGRPTACPAVASIAEHCGLAEPEVQHALRQLSRYRLLEFTEERRGPQQAAVRICRIVGMQDDSSSDGEHPEVPPEDAAEEAWARALDEGVAVRRLFDTLIDVCGYDREDLDDAARDQVFAALSIIRSAGGDPDRVRDAGSMYRSAAPDLPLTPRNLAVAWDLLQEAAAITPRHEAS